MEKKTWNCISVFLKRADAGDAVNSNRGRHCSTTKENNLVPRRLRQRRHSREKGDGRGRKLGQHVFDETSGHEKERKFWRFWHLLLMKVFLARRRMSLTPTLRGSEVVGVSLVSRWTTRQRSTAAARLGMAQNYRPPRKAAPPSVILP